MYHMQFVVQIQFPYRCFRNENFANIHVEYETFFKQIFQNFTQKNNTAYVPLIIAILREIWE